ncbi:MAG: hypothetical protein ACP5D6_06320 [Kosmotogaceae bacterium]
MKFGEKAYHKGIKDNPNDDEEFFEELKKDKNMATLEDMLNAWHTGWRSQETIEELMP